MLSEKEIYSIARAFVNEVFVLPNACATINLDHILWEINFVLKHMDAGTPVVHSKIFRKRKNAAWVAVITRLISEKMNPAPAVEPEPQP